MVRITSLASNVTMCTDSVRKKEVLVKLCEIFEDSPGAGSEVVSSTQKLLTGRGVSSCSSLGWPHLHFVEGSKNSGCIMYD